jgi:tetratricopeptide (TPR) repeat protein
LGALVWRDHATLFKQMIASDNGRYRGYWLLALEARRNGRTDAALGLFARAYALYPRDPALVMDYTITLYEQRQFGRAVPLMRELMTSERARRDPYWPAMYLDILGRAFGPDSVIAAGDRLLAEAPTPRTALFVGYAHELRGDLTGATRIYQQGLELSPADTALAARLRESKQPHP